MAFPINIPIPNEGTIASYDGMDAAVGVGYKRYYGHKGTGGLFLSPERMDSDDKSTSGSPTTGAPNYLVKIDSDFDLEFKQPQKIKGKMLINYTIQGNTTANDIYLYPKIFIYHVSTANAETQLATFDGSANPFLVTAGSSNSKRRCTDLAIVGKDFTIGEKLRVNIQVFMAHGAAAVGCVGYLWHDGTARDNSATANEDTDIIVNVPFEVDI